MTALQDAVIPAPSVDYAALAPELVLVAALCVVLVVDLVLDDSRKWLLMPASFVGVLLTLGAVVNLIFRTPRTTLGGMFVVDSFAVVFKVIFCVAALLVFAISHDYLKEDDIPHGEYYVMIMSSLFGMLVISSSRDLIAVFIALEMISLPAFVLAGLRKRDLRSNEAALKFFLFGILSTAIMLFGMSLIYGVTGTTSLAGIAESLANSPPEVPEITLLAIFFIVVGFGFKVSAFPFQWWVPDTYEGSPVPVAAFLSVASKTAGFVGLFQIMLVAFVSQADVWTPFIAAMAVLTMTFGNLVALQQRHIIRLLAYSSIAQAGYILLPLALIDPTNPDLNQQALRAAMIYLLIYAFMETGAFTVALIHGQRGGGWFLDDYSGLVERSPVLTWSMTAFMFSLAGVPPLAGWVAKLFVFLAAITAKAYALAIVMAVNTVIAVFYYASLPRQMVFGKSSSDAPQTIQIPALARGALLVTALIVLAIGILPNLFSSITEATTLITSP